MSECKLTQVPQGKVVVSRNVMMNQLTDVSSRKAFFRKNQTATLINTAK
jgi:hypothetical protein